MKQTAIVWNKISKRNEYLQNEGNIYFLEQDESFWRVDNYSIFPHYNLLYAYEQTNVVIYSL